MSTKWSLTPVSAQPGDARAGRAEQRWTTLGSRARTHCHQFHPPTLRPVSGTTAGACYCQGGWTPALPLPALHALCEGTAGGFSLGVAMQEGGRRRGAAAGQAEAVPAARLSRAVFWWQPCRSLPG